MVYCKSETIIAVKKTFVIIALLFVITILNASAQQSSQDTFRKQAIQNLIALYYQSLDEQAELYNAPVYERHIPSFTSGHPFFVSDSFSNGIIGYHGLVYTSMPILYDVVRDELITLSPNSFSIVPMKLKVDSFSFSGHQFIKLKNDTSELATLSYYERLSNGNVQLLAKRKKAVETNNGTRTVERQVYAQDRYYIYRGGIFETIKNRNGLLDALKDKKNVLQQFIKQNKLNFKQNFEEDAVLLVAYYNQLN